MRPQTSDRGHVLWRINQRIRGLSKSHIWTIKEKRRRQPDILTNKLFHKSNSPTTEIRKLWYKSCGHGGVHMIWEILKLWIFIDIFYLCGKILTVVLTVFYTPENYMMLLYIWIFCWYEQTAETREVLHLHLQYIFTIVICTDFPSLNEIHWLIIMK